MTTTHLLARPLETGTGQSSVEPVSTILYFNLRRLAFDIAETFSELRFRMGPEQGKVKSPKHGVAFDQAVTVFHDPRAISVFDDEHSKAEDRWITIGISAGGQILVVHHTFAEKDENTARIRIFSSRKATKNEAGQYGE